MNTIKVSDKSEYKFLAIVFTHILFDSDESAKRFAWNMSENYVTGYNGMGHYTGFCLTEGSRNQQVEITPEGDAVLNLYYDRILYNFRFYLYR